MCNKKYIVILLFFAAFFIIGTPIIFAQSPSVCVGNSLTKQDTFSVGEVRTSILRPEDFQSINGPEWVLMDGRLLEPPTELNPHIFHLGYKIPDARGRFLRMADHGAEVDSDGDRSRNLGGPQEDALQNIRGYMYQIAETWDDYGKATGAFIHGGNKYVTGGTPNAPDYSNTGSLEFDASKAVDPNNVHVKTDPYETRPANIAVNYFIKVCECRTADCK